MVPSTTVPRNCGLSWIHCRDLLRTQRCICWIDLTQWNFRARLLVEDSEAEVLNSMYFRVKTLFD